MPEEILHCKYCFNEIDSKAKICHHCGKWQKSCKNYPWPTIISVVIIVLALLEFREATFKRIEAKHALLMANEAIFKADSLTKQIEYLGTDLKQNMNFTLTTINAQNDSRSAFDSLYIWSNDLNNPFNLKSKEFYNHIKSKLEEPKSDFGNEPNVTDFNTKISSIKELIDFFNKNDANERIDIVRLVGYKRTTLSKDKRNEFYIYVIENDNSLRVVEWAGLFLILENNLPFSSLEIDKLIDWYNSKK